MSGWFGRRGARCWLLSPAAAALGLLLGLGLMAIFSWDQALPGLRALALSGLTTPSGLRETARVFGPVLLCGLSAALAGQAGLYNLGAPGQMALGALLALAGALMLRFPWWACLLLSMLGGALWGTVPGFLRARRGVHEGLSTALLNWIGVYLANLLLVSVPGLLPAADWQAKIPGAVVPGIGAGGVNAGLIISLAAAGVLWALLGRTTFGYGLRACGSGEDAARYGGVDAEKTQTLALTLAGALAGLGGALLTLAPGASFEISEAPDPLGFAGIAAAALGAGHPLGTVLGALAVSVLLAGGQALPDAYPREIATAVLALIALICLLPGPGWKRGKTRGGREEKRP